MYYALKGTLHVTCSQCAYPVIFFYNGKPAMLIQYCGHCGKPRHQFVYISANSSRLYRSAISPEISTQRFARV